MKDFLTGTVIFTSLVMAVLFALSDESVVAVDQDGKCQWVEIAPGFERKGCPAELPTKYNKVIVSSGWVE
tara:strand:- start:829 stop:1038 length:210 start_codon:yes stop_codon:yes gene_type:complete